VGPTRPQTEGSLQVHSLKVSVHAADAVKQRIDVALRVSDIIYGICTER